MVRTFQTRVRDRIKMESKSSSGTSKEQRMRPEQLLQRRLSRQYSVQWTASVRTSIPRCDNTGGLVDKVQNPDKGHQNRSMP